MIKQLRPFIFVVPFLLPLASAHAQEGEELTVKSPIPFAGIAQIHTLQAKGKNYKAKAVYPTFNSSTPLARFVSAKLSSYVVGDYNTWLKETKKALVTDTNPMAPYEYLMQPSLDCFQPNKLISIDFANYQYLGGAHGMDVILASNYGIVGGRPKELKLGDFFRPGTAYRSMVQRKIFAKLKKDQNASWVQDGTVKKLTEVQFNNFTVSSKGLTWTFNPYEMGPYAAGMFEITLSPAELGTRFKREMMG